MFSMPLRRTVVVLFCTILCMALVSHVADAEETAGDDGSNTALSTTEIRDASVTETEANVPLAGHSAHGAAYNEGPRQNAYLMEGTGNVAFPVTTENTQAEAFFNQGIGQLHGFWYYEAERSFRRVKALDPSCAMAYWGMAMANRDNQDRAKEFIAEAVEKKCAASSHEQMYIDALATWLQSENKKEADLRRQYVKDLERIIRRYPTDIEAKAFLAVHLWQSKRHLPINSHQAIDSMLGDVFRVNPMHPAHHYRIHLWDREHPEQALVSAARCGQAAPTIAHMWHMPGHIYSRLKRYQDASWQQEASARTDHAHMMRDRVLPDQIHNYAHNNEWLVRNLIFLGRVNDALSLAKNMVEVPRHPKYNSFDKNGSCSCKYGRRRLMQVLETFELWDKVVRLSKTMYLEPTDRPEQQAKRWRLLGVARYHRGECEGLAKCITGLDELLRVVPTEAEKAGEQAAKKAREEEKDDTEIAQAKKKAVERAERLGKTYEKALAELRGLQFLARGQTEAADEQFDQASDIPRLRLARYHFLCGDHTKAEELVEEAVTKGENEVPPLATQVDLLRKLGRKQDAQAAFERLRTVAAVADLETPLLKRLSKFAAELRWPEDWALSEPPHDDVGDRPPLDSLGPFRWGPSPAQDWSLVDAHGSTMSLADYRGRPVVVIFYLGFGCLHCVEQLHEFAPMVDEFEKAGISLVAISSDGKDALTSSLENFSPNRSFPIPLVSDAQLRVFKAYRAHDDFEEMPLHGTFLIDGQGMVRWQDIGYDPFDDAEFLLKEAQRVLSIPTSSSPPANASPSTAISHAVR